MPRKHKNKTPKQSTVKCPSCGAQGFAPSTIPGQCEFFGGNGPTTSNAQPSA